MAEIPAMLLWTDAYMADTSHLTTIEHGAYLLVLMAMWRAGGQLPDDEIRLARTARLSLDKWRRIAPTIRSFLTAADGFVSQKRLKQEFENARGRAEKASIGGNASAASKELKRLEQASTNVETEKIPEAIQTPTLPNPKPIEERNLTVSCPKRVRTRNEYPSEFEEFWQGFPTDKLMSKKVAYDVWKRLGPDDHASAVASLPAFRAYCLAHPDYRVVHACRYLSQRRFDGFLEIALKTAAQVLVKPNTPQWKAWDAWWHEHKGKPMPFAEKAKGWYCDSEWPPTEAAA